MKATDIPGVSAGQLNLSAVTRLENGLEIEFNSSASFQLPYLFLRDSCETCFERRSGRRLFSVAGDLSEVRAEDAGIVRRKGFNGLLVLWEGGMQSTFEASWLLDKCVTLDAVSTRLPCRIWGCAEMADSIASFNFREVLGADRAQLHLLEALVERDGVALIRGAPPRQSSLRDLGHRVFASSTLARTFQIEIDADDRSSSNRHIRGARALHSELAYCEDSPGIMAMLCVRLKTANADEIAGELPEDADGGGKLMLVDGLMLARNMERVFPQEYHTLATTMVSFRKSSISQNDLCELRASRPVFTLDCDGAMKRICVDEQHRTRYQSFLHTVQRNANMLLPTRMSLPGMTSQKVPVCLNYSCTCTRFMSSRNGMSCMHVKFFLLIPFSALICAHTTACSTRQSSGIHSLSQKSCS